MRRNERLAATGGDITQHRDKSQTAGKRQSRLGIVPAGVLLEVAEEAVHSLGAQEEAPPPGGDPTGEA
jgi:hypothetical protein